MEFSCGKWRQEVCHRFSVVSSIFCLPVQLNCFAFVFVSSLVQCCAQLSSSSCSVIPIPCSVNFSFVFLFLFLFFFFGFDFASHIFTTRPQTISWLDSHRIDGRVEERLPSGKAYWMFACNVRFPFFYMCAHSFFQVLTSCI